MKKEVDKKSIAFKVLLCLFFPVGICYFLVWALKKLVVMADSGHYDDDVNSDRERMEFTLAGEPGRDVRNYLAEGVKVDLEYSPDRDMHTVTSGNDYVGYIDRRNAKAYEAFSPTAAYVRKVDNIDGRCVVTIIAFK